MEKPTDAAEVTVSKSIDNMKKKLKSDTQRFETETALKLGHRNFRLHVVITVLSLLLTLSLTIIGLLDDAQISVNQRKVWAGVLGAILATIQTASATFNFKRKSEGYFSLDVEEKNLELDIDDSDNEEELKKCRERLKELRTSALKLEL